MIISVMITRLRMRRQRRRGFVLPALFDSLIRIHFAGSSATGSFMIKMQTAAPRLTIPLNSPAGFLNDKAVLLFLELKRKGLRNCSPNNCDDRGAEVTASVKRLLVKRDDLKKIVAAANALGSGLTSSDLENALLDKLNLPDMRLMRFDVLNSGPTTSNDVFGAFLKVFQAGKLAAATGISTRSTPTPVGSAGDSRLVP